MHELHDLQGIPVGEITAFPPSVDDREPGVAGGTVGILLGRVGGGHVRRPPPVPPAELQIVLLEQDRDLVVGEIGKLPVGDVDGRRHRHVLDRHADEVGGAGGRRKRLLRHVEEANRLRHLEQVALVLCTQPVHPVVGEADVMDFVGSDRVDKSAVCGSLPSSRHPSGSDAMTSMVPASKVRFITVIRPMAKST